MSRRSAARLRPGTERGDAGDHLAAFAVLGPATLAGFTVLQLVVYAALQVPAGVLLDRFGSRRLLVVGGLVMAVGQVVLALSEHVLPAYLGRVLVGAGDALTFVSVLRLVTAWFPGSRAPVLTQLTGLLGQTGQILSAVPLVAVLHGPGWEPAFLGVAAVGVLVTLLTAVAVQDAPGTPVLHGPKVDLGRVGRSLRVAWLHPGTRLGLWSHFTTQFPGVVFALMWGYPFLVSAQGLSPAAAGRLLSLMVVIGIASAPVIGVLVQRHPLRRSWLVLAVVGANAAAWTAVLAWPGTSPLWLLVLLVASMALSGPGSMIGFDFARTFNPPNRLGTATGIVNVGGLVASLITILVVGVALDVSSGGGTGYTLDDFRAALSVQYLVWAFGLVGIVRTRRLARARLAQRGVVVPPVREVLARRRRTRRG